MPTSKMLSIGLSLITVSLLSANVAFAQSKGQPFDELETRVDHAESKITVLEELSGVIPLDTEVNCDAGESINQTLGYFGDVAAPLVLTITGTCVENVVIDRGNVSLLGTPGAVIQDASEGAFGSSVVHITRGAAGVELHGLTINNSTWGLYCNENSTVLARNIVINGGIQAVVSSSGASCRVENAVINGPGIGVSATMNSTAIIRGSQIRNARLGVQAQAGAAVFLGTSGPTNPTRILDSRDMGVRLLPASNLVAESLEVAGSVSDGIEVYSGAGLTFQGSSTIQDNGGHGIDLWKNATMMVFVNSLSLQLSGNGGMDIACHENASLLAGIPISASEIDPACL